MFFGFMLEDAWLSSSDTQPFVYEGVTFKSVQQAYQYNKCANAADAQKILALKSYDAHKFGQTVERKPDWSTNKYTILAKILHAKFSEQQMRKLLLDTEADYLCCTSPNAKDAYWGYYLYEKHKSITDNNYYGKTLMLVRYCLSINRDIPSLTPAFLDSMTPLIVSAEDIRLSEETCNVFNRRFLRWNT